MSSRFWLGLAAALALAAGTVRADLTQAKAEPNLEKRSKLAADAAGASLKLARAAYQQGELEQCRKFIADTTEAVEFSGSSLDASGKDPRRRPKWFKRAEMELRELIRRMDTFSQAMSYADRPMLEELRAKAVKVHDSMLTGLMEGKRK